MANDTIVLGGGCFWCTEAVFNLFKGVIRTMPGYAGGNIPNPTYDQVCTGRTGHAEVLQVEYDPNSMPLDTILDIFLTMHDPTSLNRQGADMGTQYRSIILCTTDQQARAVEAFVKGAQKDFSKPIVTEIRKLDKFYPAEEYHRRYYERNRLQPYCGLVIGPKVAKVKKKYGLH